jgi:hypothetical protein
LLLEGEANVVVCDGFTGNVALKTLEGTIRTVLQALRSEIRGSTMGSSAACWSDPPREALRARLDPDTYGGGYLLGTAGARRDRARLELARRDRQRTRMAARGRRARVGGSAGRTAARDPRGVARVTAPPWAVRVLRLKSIPFRQ